MRKSLALLCCKQTTAYEIPKRDWSSDVCSSDLASFRGVQRSEPGKLLLVSARHVEYQQHQLRTYHFNVHVQRCTARHSVRRPLRVLTACGLRTTLRALLPRE